MADKARAIKVAVVGVCLFCFIGGSPIVSPAMEPVNLKLASFKVGSGWYVLGGIMADVIKSGLPEGSTVDAMPKAGAVGNPMLIGAKKADFALAFPVTANWAYNGTQNYTERIPNIRVVVAGLDTTWILGAVRADSGIKSWTDLKERKIGLRISTQSKGSLSEVGATQILGKYGIPIEDLEKWGGKLLMQGFTEMVPALKDGAIDGFLMMATPNHPTWSEIAISRDMRFISMEETIIKEMVDEYGYSSATVPAGMYTGQDHDTRVIGFPTLIITRSDMDDDIVYHALKAIIEHAEKIKIAYKPAQVFDPKTAWKAEKRGGVPLHPGAEKFYRDQGWM
jgi:TRAP transporter TAXI family solute receptor